MVTLMISHKPLFKLIFCLKLDDFGNSYDDRRGGFGNNNFNRGGGGGGRGGSRGGYVPIFFKEYSLFYFIERNKYFKRKQQFNRV